MAYFRLQFLFLGSIAVFLPVSYYHGYIPLLVPYLYLFSSMLCFVFYAIDKSSAVKGKWRIPEDTLHAMSVACGWPGAIIAQERLRHKTQKLSFRRVFWFTIITNYGMLLALHVGIGSKLLRNLIYGLEQLVKGNFEHPIPGKFILALCVYQSS